MISILGSAIKLSRECHSTLQLLHFLNKVGVGFTVYMGIDFILKLNRLHDALHLIQLVIEAFLFHQLVVGAGFNNPALV